MLFFVEYIMSSQKILNSNYPYSSKNLYFSAVRFGRVPKREKARMFEEMQKTNVQSQRDQIAIQYENLTEVMHKINQAFGTLQATVGFLGVT